MEIAEQRDQQLAKARAAGTQESLGLFFGVPISIKDQIEEANKTLSVGSTWMMSHYIAKKDATIVRMLKEQGAIPMVRGNLPQFVFVGFTNNKIYGMALNPFDQERTCSGSSGGDTGLVAANCVPFGIGTDIGGSIRGPAAACGIIGFKPTS